MRFHPALTIHGFLDDHAQTAPLPGYQILGAPTSLDEVICAHGDAKVIIGIGDNRTRLRIARSHLASYPVADPLVHPFSCASRYAQFGFGSVLMPGVVVNAGTRVGSHVILNTACSVDHDCVIGDYAHISPGAHLAGSVIVGEGCHIGTGASVIPGVRIGEWSVIGAGAVVTSDNPARSLAVGVPARVIKTLD